jgi:ergothioneine biosynthesis protein EgtB
VAGAPCGVWSDPLRDLRADTTAAMPRPSRPRHQADRNADRHAGPETDRHAALALVDALRRVRAQSISLVEPLTPEDCQAQSMPDASPAKWHLAHTTWFFETFVLEGFEPGFRPHDQAFRVLFNSYYQAVGPQHPRPSRGLITRPTLDEVKAWRAAVDERLAALLATCDDPALHALVTLGLQHEQQHQELMLTDLKHLLWQNPARPAYRSRWPLAEVRPAPQGWVGVDVAGGGEVEIGHAPALDGGFAFDNETPRHALRLLPFELATRPVTHGDWLAFMADGGYRRPELWLAMGWDWVQAGRREAPLYWQRPARDANAEAGADPSAGPGADRSGNDWQVFTLQGLVPLDPHTPLPHLSYFEADAYARWAGARLPTEAEWEHAARQVPLRGHFADRGAFHPLPDTGGAGLRQLYGDVWEWTSSAYAAYPRYRPSPGAIGEYNGKFMCNQFVLRGGSCATPAGHVRASYRNFFPPEAQWQFSGLRLARDA